MQRSTSYIIMFAAAVCLVCAIFVSGSAVALKSKQEANKILDRQKKVLAVAGLLQEGSTATPAEIGKLFEDNIKAKIVVLESGAYDETTDVTTFDQLKATKDENTSDVAPANLAGIPRVPRKALVYQYVKGDDLKSYILPIEGKGLWSTLYGSIALDRDCNTIKGITFYQHAETPGLGGEVDNPRWKGLWPGKLAFANEKWDTPAVEVIKGMAEPGDPHQIDGLSGATITARGVSYLVQFWLGKDGFGSYLKKMRGGAS